MALIVVIAVMAGFESDLKTRILGIESHLVVRRHGEPIRDYREINNRVASLPGVAAATPIVHDQIMLRSAAGVSGAVVRGIDTETAGGVISVLTPEILSKLQKAHSKRAVISSRRESSWARNSAANWVSSSAT